MTLKAILRAWREDRAVDECTRAKYRQIMTELSQMTHRDLIDIGLDLDEAVRITQEDARLDVPIAWTNLRTRLALWFRGAGQDQAVGPVSASVPAAATGHVAPL